MYTATYTPVRMTKGKESPGVGGDVEEAGASCAISANVECATTWRNSSDHFLKR